ncbi:DUF6707 family protein [Listeria ilorinensis]|uniref:DUF6707 family protein n=1 Tax=Listeria ilorinensis TaxID=2867439 RepID=UPI001EF64979|nr:DUF6707 family protein [Listeria ilorinensis]
MEILEEISQQCSEKKIIQLSHKLAKKCSFKSGADMENLCHLVYWLYVYGYDDLTLSCISLTHEVPFNQNYRIWTFIHNMWGLEIRILKERGRTDLAQKITESIDAHYLLPTKLEPTVTKRKAMEERRRERFTYETVSNREQIEATLAESDVKSANTWRFTALLSMIGNTETGLYPALNESKGQIEGTVQSYMEILRQS